MSPSGTPDRDSPPPLEARSLIRDFGALRAVDGIDLALEPGEVVALFGPNGAGKSTLLRMLGGGLLPTSGEVRVGGEPLRPSDHERHRHIGVLSHRSFLYAHLTAAENLRFYGRLFDLGDLDERVPERLAAVGLEGRASDRVEGFSRGMRQRLALARTLLHDPEIVLLDEPYTGLDPHAAATLRGVLSSLRDGRRSVVLVTHNLIQGLELSDRVMVIVRGKVAYSSRAAEIDADRFEHLYHQTVEEAV
ncbi:MAG: heme ABC exporter ATP-binding protein CcmA [Longimicrobiales bacterium]|nr:heme ABC exporter ATP-binding protein CcmA [Longimicrobiales bacterium]